MGKVYDEKVAVLRKTADHEETGRMPIISVANTWAVAYAGHKTAECLESSEKQIEIFGKILKDMYFDGTFGFGLGRPLKLYEPLGFGSYFISGDGISMQSVADTAIFRNIEEVRRFILDPMKFLKEIGTARRYPALMQDSPDDLSALKKSFQLFLGGLTESAEKEKALRDVYETPDVISGGIAGVPFDQYLRYRGLRESLIDLRRHPQEVQEACEVIASMQMFTPAKENYEDFPWILSNSIGITFLNPVQFEKFVVPTYSKVLDRFISRGARIFVGMEKVWGREKYQFLNSFPAHSIIASVEGDDPVQVQKDIGDKVALCYPFPNDLIRNGTPDEVVKEAEMIVHKMGTRGMYMFLERALLCPGDAKAENYRALSEFCRDYHS